MAKVQVRALRLGYYDNKRRREGQVFHMDDSEFHKDGKGKVSYPSWVEPVGKNKPKAHQEIDELEVEKIDDDVI